MGYIPIVLPLIAGAVFALAVFLRRETKPASKRSLLKLAVAAGGFVAISLAASVNLALNGGWS